MKKFCFISFLFWAIGFFSLNTSALPTRIVSGQILIGGTSFGTNDHQKYLRFLLIARVEMPRRDFIMDAEQPFSEYLGHPVQPNGDYEYQLVMPHGGQRLRINDESFFPVWYAESVWRMKSSVVTPTASSDSPQFVFVEAPFTMSGSTVTYGNYRTGFKSLGKGTVRIKFEKINNKYYLLEALYNFGYTQPTDKKSS
jgi:hypothetical protein